MLENTKKWLEKKMKTRKSTFQPVLDAGIAWNLFHWNRLNFLHTLDQNVKNLIFWRSSFELSISRNLRFPQKCFSSTLLILWLICRSGYSPNLFVPTPSLGPHGKFSNIRKTIVHDDIQYSACRRSSPTKLVWLSHL